MLTHNQIWLPVQGTDLATAGPQRLGADTDGHFPEDVASVMLDCMCFPDALESQKRAADLLGLEL